MKPTTIVPTLTATFLVALLPAAVARAQTAPGHTFNVSVTTQKNGKDDGKPLSLKVSVAGNNGRVDIVRGDGDEYKDGDYILTNDAGETFWAVSMRKRRANQVSAQTIRAAVAKEKFSVKNVSLSPPAPTGAGETIAAIPTNRSRVARGYTISARELFFSVNIAVTETWDFDMATGDAARVPAFNPAVSYFALTSSAMLFKNDAFAARKLSETLPKGFALKVVGEAAAREGKKSEREGSTITCDAPVAAPLAASLFALPTGVKREN